MRGFISSLALVALFLLAINPQVVVEIENRIWPEIVLPDLPDLPETYRPADGEPLPRLPAYERIARNDVWIGATPCGTDIFDAPDKLPALGPRRDGAFLSKPIDFGAGEIVENRPTHVYAAPSGATLRYVEPVIVYYDVSGRNFREAQNDIFTRKPLEREGLVGRDPDAHNPAASGRVRVTVLAHILSPTLLTYTMRGRVRPRNTAHTLVPERTVLTSAFIVTLPRWTAYASAGPRDRARWDDLFCNAAHHELGHLRIRLDLLAQTLDGYAALSAPTQPTLKDEVAAYRADVTARIQDRQDAYHVYNGGGVRRGMIERPYAELPFPWLEDDAPELFAEDRP